MAQQVKVPVAESDDLIRCQRSTWRKKRTSLLRLSSDLCMPAVTRVPTHTNEMNVKIRYSLKLLRWG